MDENNEKRINQALSLIKKKFSDDAIMRLGKDTTSKFETVSTGCPSLDKALGGGFGKGRIVEIYGPYSSGKTTVALHAIAEVQRQGGIALFVDVEHALDVKYAAAIGINLDDLLLTQPSCGDEALEIVDQLLMNNAIDIAVIDSVAALVPKAELEGEMGKSNMALQARLMSQALRKMTPNVNRSQAIVLFINQERETMSLYGQKNTTSGGKALEYYCSQKIRVRKTEVLKQKGETGSQEQYGIRVSAEVTKNKIYAPFKTAEFDIIFGEGISKVANLVDVLEDKGILDKRGAFYFYKDENIARGRNDLIEMLKENKKLYKELEDALDKDLNESIESEESA